MTTRITVTLPDDLHSALVRVSDASHVSASATVRAVLSDVLPRMSRMLDFLGTTPEVKPEDVEAAEAWTVELQRFLSTAPGLLGTIGDPQEAGDE